MCSNLTSGYSGGAPDNGGHGSVDSLISNQDQLNALVGLTTSALQQSSIDDLAWDVVHKVVEILAFEDCLIYLYDKVSGELIQKAAYGPKELRNQHVLGPLRLKVGRGLVGHCAKTREVILVNDTSSDPRYLVDDQPRMSELCVPIISDGELVGVIDSESSRSHFYSDEHVQLLTAVAAIIATKYQSQQSIAELRQTVHRLEYAEKLQQAVFNIAELVYTTDSLNDFYGQMHRYVSNLIDGDVFFVGLMDEDGNAIHLPYPGETEVDYPMPTRIEKHQFPNSLTARVILENQPLRFNQTEIGELGRQNRHLPCHWTTYAWLAVPFVTPSGIRGAIGVQRATRQEEFDDHDQELLVYISQQVGNAIKRKQDESALQQLALSDPLTSLPNRTLFMDRLEHALRRDRSVDSFQTHVFFIDLDRFKYINDAYGHHVGDEILVEVGNRVKSCLRGSDTLGRISGDEFAIVLQDVDRPDVLGAISRRIANVFKVPVETSAGEIKLSASIGICSASEELHEGEELLKMADHAMYQSKATGQGEAVISSQTESEVSHTRRVEAELASALANDEFELHFQPIYSLLDQRITGFEVLTRWQHPELGLLYPDKFIDIAEKSGQIIALDYHVLRKSAELLHQWRRAEGHTYYLNVNISGRTLSSAGFVDIVKGYYQNFDLQPGSLNIEVTEQCLIGDLPGAIEQLTEVSELGARIFLDDFGTGYSSLNYLHRLPIDVLKIDRSFVKSFCDSPAAESIVKTIVMLANNLNIGIVAEGIEEEGHITALTGLSVNHGQGYLLGRPVPLQHMPELECVLN